MEGKNVDTKSKILKQTLTSAKGLTTMLPQGRDPRYTTLISIVLRHNWQCILQFFVAGYLI